MGKAAPDQFEHRDPVVKGASSSPTQMVGKHLTSLAWDNLCGNEEPARISSPVCPRHVISVLKDYTFPLYHLAEEDRQAKHINSF